MPAVFALANRMVEYVWKGLNHGGGHVRREEKGLLAVM